MRLQSFLSLLVILKAASILAQGDAESDVCRDETAPLLADESLGVAQRVVLEDYEASYNDVCDFGLSSLGCSIRFEGDERTYEALCEAQGGQIYERPVILTCLLGSIDYDLGFIPICVAASCNVTTIEPEEVETELVEAFLDNLAFVGCKAGSAASRRATSSLVSILVSCSLTTVSIMLGALSFLN